MKKKILFLCTGNSARSQLAEALLRHFRGDEFDAYSAGTAPQGVHPKTIEVLREIGVDTSALYSKHIDDLPVQAFGYVITLCDAAAQNCPVFTGSGKKIHHGFTDPAARGGTDAQVLDAFRTVRDEIRVFVENFDTCNPAV